ncbi:hypothetical protein MJ390_00920 [Klebsiella pneumoniae]|nr:hypothetical protein MJ390_00920 [Klebsiella pneumoniae]
MESNDAKRWADITDPATGAVIVKKGQQLSSFAQRCEMMAPPPPAAAGSSPGAGRRKVTRWRAAITPIHPVSAMYPGLGTGLAAQPPHPV